MIRRLLALLRPPRLPYGMRDCPDCEGMGWVWERIRCWNLEGFKQSNRRVGCRACGGKAWVPL